jgi:hypothetical protein
MSERLDKALADLDAAWAECCAKTAKPKVVGLSETELSLATQRERSRERDERLAEAEWEALSDGERNKRLFALLRAERSGRDLALERQQAIDFHIERQRWHAEQEQMFREASFGIYSTPACHIGIGER